eukprot:PhF_6_TR43160/c0_g1_i3/m.66096
MKSAKGKTAMFSSAFFATIMDEPSPQTNERGVNVPPPSAASLFFNSYASVSSDPNLYSSGVLSLQLTETESRELRNLYITTGGGVRFGDVRGLRSIMSQCNVHTPQTDAELENVMERVRQRQPAEKKVQSAVMGPGAFLDIMLSVKQAYFAGVGGKDRDTVDAFVATGGNRDKTGIVQGQLLSQRCKEFQLTIDIDRLLSEIDEDGNGTVDYHEFETLLGGAARGGQGEGGGEEGGDVKSALGSDAEWTTTPDPRSLFEHCGGDADVEGSMVYVGKVIQNINLFHAKVRFLEYAMELLHRCPHEYLTYDEFLDHIYTPFDEYVTNAELKADLAKRSTQQLLLPRGMSSSRKPPSLYNARLAVSAKSPNPSPRHSSRGKGMTSSNKSTNNNPFLRHLGSVVNAVRHRDSELSDSSFMFMENPIPHSVEYTEMRKNLQDTLGKFLDSSSQRPVPPTLSRISHCELRLRNLVYLRRLRLQVLAHSIQRFGGIVPDFRASADPHSITPAACAARLQRILAGAYGSMKTMLRTQFRFLVCMERAYVMLHKDIHVHPQQCECRKVVVAGRSVSNMIQQQQQQNDTPRLLLESAQETSLTPLVPQKPPITTKKSSVRGGGAPQQRKLGAFATPISALVAPNQDDNFIQSVFAVHSKAVTEGIQSCKPSTIRNVHLRRVLRLYPHK